MDLPVLAILVPAIGVVTWLAARAAIRRDAKTPRGLEPGQGDHIIEVEYSSGLGGGDSTRIRVPRDPAKYAEAFVPKGKKR